MPVPSATKSEVGPVSVVNNSSSFGHSTCATSKKQLTSVRNNFAGELTEDALQKILQHISLSSTNNLPQQKSSAATKTMATAAAKSQKNCCVRNHSLSSTASDSSNSPITSSSTESSSLMSSAELELCSGLQKLCMTAQSHNDHKHRCSPGCCNENSSSKKHHSCGGQKKSASAESMQQHAANSSEHGKWLSPQEYFQLSRLRSTALASKLGGNSCSVLLMDASELPKPAVSVSKKPSPAAASVKQRTASEGDIDSIANAIKSVSLSDNEKIVSKESPLSEATGEKSAAAKGEAEEKENVEPKAEEAKDTEEQREKSDAEQPATLEPGELIGRGPIQVYSTSNRNAAYSPYETNRYGPAQQHQSMFNNARMPPVDGMSVNQTPAEFFAMQRQKQNQRGNVQISNNNNSERQQQPGPFMQHPYSPPNYTMVHQGEGYYSNHSSPPQAMQQPVDQYGNHREELSPYNMEAITVYGQAVSDTSYSPGVVSQTDYFYQTQPGDIPASPENYPSPCVLRGDDTMHNLGYNGSCYSPQNAPSIHLSPNSAASAESAPSPFADEHLSNVELQRILNSAELPDSLSDFILKFSRRYSTDTPSSMSDRSSTYSGCQRKISFDESLGSISEAQSPFSSAASSGYSPPSSGYPSPTNEKSNKIKKNQQQDAMVASMQTNLGVQQRFKAIRPRQGAQRRSSVAKARLRSLLSDKEYEGGWAWALRCSQAGPAALYYRDADGDSLLHIVVWHKDLAKVMGLVEIMMRDEHAPYGKPVDLPNKMEETPMFLAVEKRLPEVVAYLMECGADPNRKSFNRDGDASIHYAAARGMSEIVAELASSPVTNLNLVNGCGLTPLLCAVKNHGVIEEESQCLVNNKPTIRTLLKQGADPKISDATCGKTVLHYAVERMDPDLVEIFRDNMSKEEMLQLVNTPMFNGDTPLHILGYMASQRGAGLTRGEGEEDLRRKMFLTLANCGADVTLANNQGQCPVQQFTIDFSTKLA